ncbi:AAA family ATPase [Paraburkholderia fungorum]
MRFESITLCNMFSYFGEVSFRFNKPAKPGANIVLIYGRNGQGKTSFLTALKLLFAGVTNEVRNQVQAGRVPSLNQYICGTGDDWWGILNHKARLDGINTCYIEVKWETEEGDIVSARRSWTLNLSAGTFQEQVQTNDPYLGLLSDDVARDYLQRILPRDYLPFYIFDGEDIRQLAEANRGETIEKMEMLLNIRPVENVRTALSDLRHFIQDDAMDAIKQKELVKLQNRYAEVQAGLVAAEQELSVNEENIGEAETELKQVGRQLSALRGYGSGEEFARESQKISEKEARRADLQNEISDEFGRDGVLKCIPSVVAEALNAMETVTAHEATASNEMLATLKVRFDQMLVEPPYPSKRLTEEQVQFYRDRVGRLVEYYEQAVPMNVPFKLDPARARRLISDLSAYRASRASHSSLNKNVEEARLLGVEVATLKTKLLDISSLRDRERERFEAFQARQIELTDTLLSLRDAHRVIKHRVDEFGKIASVVETEISGLRANVKVAADTRKKYDFMKKLVDTLDELKQTIKADTRVLVEQYLNEHLHSLLDSNALVSRAEIGDDFSLTYYTAAGEPIGMASISSGMKQLVATALIWALKDASGREVPVIVDTPLGRIDYQHQINLLTHYYPRAGRQVIILPTDSELNATKYAILKPYIAQEFWLQNPSGMETKFRETEETEANA